MNNELLYMIRLFYDYIRSILLCYVLYQRGYFKMFYTYNNYIFYAIFIIHKQFNNNKYYIFFVIS
jgi:hypothetical protein